MAAPLYPLTKDGLFSWGEKEQKAFDAIKLALMSAPALGLLDVTKPFHLFVAENGDSQRGADSEARTVETARSIPIKLDPVAAGWPACLQIIATAAVLVKDVDKFDSRAKSNSDRSAHARKHNPAAPASVAYKCSDNSLPSPVTQL